MNSPITTLVLGASGRQGGAVAHELLAHAGEGGRERRVRAFTRDANSPAIRALIRGGARVFSGDWRDLDSLTRAMEGVESVFAVTSAVAGPLTEVKLGSRILEAANIAGVRHLVYSSVASADRGTGIPFFESKHRIEQRLRRFAIPHTVVAPVFFMENYLAPPLVGGLAQGRLEMPLPSGLRFQQLALRDLAACVRFILEQPARFLGRRIELASDEVSVGLTAEILSFALGTPIRPVRIPLERVAETSRLGVERMYQWLEEEGFRVDLEGERELFPGVHFHSLADWALAQDWGAHHERRRIA